MPLPAANLYPPFNIVRLSHCDMSVTNLARSKDFYAETIGLQVTDEEDGVVYFRGLEERTHHCLILRESDAPSVRSLGFRVFDEEDLDRAAAHFRKQGRAVSWIDRPFTGRVLSTTCPLGIPLEFHARMDRLPPIHQEYDRYRGVRPLRVDHFNCFSPDVEASVHFFGELGFRVTEYTEDEATKDVWAAWMHRKGGVHDIAFINGRGPRLHHVAFWVPTPLAIIDLLDKLATTGYVANIERGPGRHGLSNAFFLYIFDPDGHRLEFYCSDYLTVDPDLEPIKWDLNDPQRQTLWGAVAPPSFYEDGTFFKDTPTEEPTLKSAPPMTH